MYLQNKYTHWYYNIISTAQSRQIEGYVERHHIIPKSLGGSNEKENLVPLTAREHFICHWLLTKMVDNTNNRMRMLNAFWSMARKNQCQLRYEISGRKYEILKKAITEARSHFNIGNKFAKGYVRTADHNRKIVESRSWYTRSENTNRKQSETMKEKYASQEYVHAGKTYEDIYGKEEAEIRKNNLKGPRGPRKNPPGSQELITCPHCGKTGGISNMKRYHFDNCGVQ